MTLNSVRALQIFNILRFGGTFLIGVLLAKSGLPTAEIALYETLLFLSNLLSFFWVMGGQNALLQFFPTLEERTRPAALFNTFCLFLGAGAFAAAVLWFGADWLTRHLTRYESLPYLPYVCLFLVFQPVGWLLHHYYLLLKNYGAILWVGALSFSLQVAAVVGPIFLGYSLEVSFQALALWAFLRFAFLCGVVWKHGARRFDWTYCRAYLLLALPLVLHILIGHGMEYIDGIIVSTFFEERSVFAIYRYGAREFPLALLLVGGLVSASIAEVSEDMQTGLAHLRRRVLHLFHLLFPLGLVLMLSSHHLYRLVYNEDFVASADVFNVYLLILSSRLLLPQVVLLGYRRNYVLVASAVVETVVNIALSLWWVRLWGLEGIALASVVAFFLNKLNMAVYAWAKLGIPPGAYLPLNWWAFYTALLFLAWRLTL